MSIDLDYRRRQHSQKGSLGPLKISSFKTCLACASLPVLEKIKTARMGIKPAVMIAVWQLEYRLAPGPQRWRSLSQRG